MSEINITINGKKIPVSNGITILDAATTARIRIPTLCFLKGLDSHASCRMCVVAVEGARTLQPACITKVSEGMVIHTNSPEIRKSRKNTLELLMARHSVDCHHCLRIGISKSKDLDPKFCESCFFCDCVREGICELQNLTREYEVDVIPYKVEPVNYPVDTSTGCIVLNPNKCVKCLRCVDVCVDVQTVHALSLVNRGSDMQVISAQGRPLAESPCVLCGRCVDVCPTGAVHILEQKDELLYQTHHYSTTTIAQVADDLFDELADLSGMKRWNLEMGHVVAGLKKIGVDYVVTDKVALSRGLKMASQYLEENIPKSKKPIIITSSYSAMQFVNHYFPSLSKDIFYYDSAQQQFAKIIKNSNHPEIIVDSTKKIITISITSNNENEGEATKNGSVDYVLNARELYRIFLRTGVNLKKIHKIEQDYFGDSAVLPPTMDKLLSPVVWEIGGCMDEIEVEIGGKRVKAVVGKTLGHARQLLEQVKNNTCSYQIIRISS